MSLFGNPEDLRLLQNLLNPSQRQYDSDADTDEEEQKPLLSQQKLSKLLK